MYHCPKTSYFYETAEQTITPSFLTTYSLVTVETLCATTVEVLLT